MDEILGKLAQIEAALGRSSASQDSLLAWQTLLLDSLDKLSVVESADVCTQAWRVLISFHVRQSTSQLDRKRILQCIRSVLPQGRDALQHYHTRLVPGGLSDLQRRLESCLAVSPTTPKQDAAILMPSKKLKLDADPSRALHWL